VRIRAGTAASPGSFLSFRLLSLMLKLSISSPQASRKQKLNLGSWVARIPYPGIRRTFLKVLLTKLKVKRARCPFDRWGKGKEGAPVNLLIF
jgi:hypothetical protein